MTEFEVLCIMNIDENTAIVVNAPGEYFKNGIKIWDDKKNEYEVMSVGLDGGYVSESSCDKTSLLIKGLFSSNKIYV